MPLPQCRRCDKIYRTPRGIKSRICPDCKVPTGNSKLKEEFLSTKSKEWLRRYKEERDKRNKPTVKEIIEKILEKRGK